ncbi:MAG: glycyl-radical enzyme activating protein [Paludibacter sp.]|nr:glycyl-radical enzyme activating protein [Paludibacter sp.]
MGIIFDIKRFAVHDGPGIRTTVFLKGCPLRCAWCHNPESISAAICEVPKTVRIGDKTFSENETVGREITVKELMHELEKEKIFMDESAGGVTFSGGEPLMQPEFLNEALKACKNAGMHTAVDTSGYARWEILEKTAGLTDLFLYDIKIMDDKKHQEFTGVSNKLILENLRKLSAMGKRIQVRIPCVPNVTLTEENIAQTIDFLKTLAHKPDEVNLLPYHNTAAHKYERFGMENAFSVMKSMDKKELQEVKKQFKNAGFQVKIGG